MIGILDWELCTLGSPLADLGNLLLPFSFAPVKTGGDSPGRAGMSLLLGLKGLPTRESGLPQLDEIERWWVDGMNEGMEWHHRRGHGGPVGIKWEWPIKSMK